MGVYVYPSCGETAKRHVKVKANVAAQNGKVAAKARRNLAAQNKTTRITPSGYFPAEIETDTDGVNHYTSLHAPNAMALEFGHQPSGKFAGTDTKAPEETLILTRAAYS
ncbi:tail completion or Neck1 protein [Mycobacterium phage Phlei]|uniref:Uncharacterized protein n=1 Tax=Mycobacterium phage Phlei TaxID=1690684 RepID=A0A0N9BDM3_9CAUD|nr:tail completion or Neck1 protein [Mycobacterium phage Phlei]ALA48129.1 hypothetical protein [Mycobacterium phage Phlei]